MCFWGTMADWLDTTRLHCSTSRTLVVKLFCSVLYIWIWFKMAIVFFDFENSFP